MTRGDLETAARALYDEAFNADPVRTNENVQTVLSACGKISACGVFVWSRLNVIELRALRRALYPTVLEARG